MNQFYKMNNLICTSREIWTGWKNLIIFKTKNFHLNVIPSLSISKIAHAWLRAISLIVYTSSEQLSPLFRQYNPCENFGSSRLKIATAIESDAAHASMVIFQRREKAVRKNRKAFPERGCASRSLDSLIVHAVLAWQVRTAEKSHQKKFLMCVCGKFTQKMSYVCSFIYPNICIPSYSTVVYYINNL